MNIAAKFAGATISIIVYESLQYGINHCVENYLPKSLSKYFPTKLVAGGATLALGTIGLNYLTAKENMHEVLFTQFQALEKTINYMLQNDQENSFVGMINTTFRHEDNVEVAGEYCRNGEFLLKMTVHNLG